MISYKTNHPCGPHDVEIWIQFLLDFNKNKLRRECSKRHGVLEKSETIRVYTRSRKSQSFNARCSYSYYRGNDYILAT